MKLILFLTLALTLACGGESLRARDAKLMAEIDALALRYRNTGLSAKQYRIELEELRKREKAILDEAHVSKFDDADDDHYWRRLRLKNPSRVDQELEKLTNP